ncbi:hypothetical protein ACF09G_36185 [Streptomyces albogriseolus]|uniref:hypothetical protein n=1 Tax=Streptomyces albogriseolus TaxID=1887 RepID=UPI0019BF45D8|nr:hypothetical protein [Streptomyces sp.]
MPRTPPSGADAELIALLAARGVKVSAYQLERWRAQGLLPRNPYRSLGRGRGRAARLTPEITVTAELLGRTARQGRKNADLTELVKGISAQNPAVVRAACVTGLTDLADQTGARPGHGAGPDDGAQARLDAAAHLARTQRHHGGLHNDLRALLAEHGLDVDDIPELPPMEHPALLELAVRLFSSGRGEVGLDEIADALGAAWNWPQDAVEEMQHSLARSEIEALTRGEDPWDDLPPVHDVHSLIAAVQECGDTELLRTAETVTTTSSYQMMAALGSLAGLAQPALPLAVRPEATKAMLRHPIWLTWGQFASRAGSFSNASQAFAIAVGLRTPGFIDRLADYRELLRGLLRLDHLASRLQPGAVPAARSAVVPESQAPRGDGHPGGAPFGAREGHGR